MRIGRVTVVCGWIAAMAMAACSSGGSADSKGTGPSNSDAGDTDASDAPPPSTDGGSANADSAPAADAPPSNDAATKADSGPSGTPGEAGPPPPMFGQGGATCGEAADVPLDSPQFAIDLQADTTGATPSVAAPCATAGGEVFYKLSFSKPVFLYADTFGASAPTVLYLLDESCVAMTAGTMPGGTLCSAAACGTQQSQIVAMLAAGNYKLGVAAAGSAQGPSTVHLQWALAPSGAVTELPQGSSMQSGATVDGNGNIEGLSPSCIAAGPEDAFWWATCPNAAGGSLQASTCGAATWETVLEVQVPGAIPYACDVDSCGLQTDLQAHIPAGAGLRVLTIDGQAGSDFGPYTVSADRP